MRRLLKRLLCLHSYKKDMADVRDFRAFRGFCVAYNCTLCGKKIYRYENDLEPISYHNGNH